MSVASHTTHGDHTICYRLECSLGQVKLRLWEPSIKAATHAGQSLPYLYAANFAFTSVVEAEAYLRQHLLSNGAFDVPESNFPYEGAIVILPYPTWGNDTP